MAHVVTEGEEEAAEKSQPKEDAENGTRAECYFAISTVPWQVVIVIEKVAHSSLDRLEADVETDRGL